MFLADRWGREKQDRFSSAELYVKSVGAQSRFPQLLWKRPFTHRSSPICLKTTILIHEAARDVWDSVIQDRGACNADFWLALAAFNFASQSRHAPPYWFGGQNWWQAGGFANELTSPREGTMTRSWIAVRVFVDCDAESCRAEAKHRSAVGVLVHLIARFRTLSQSVGDISDLASEGMERRRALHHRALPWKTDMRQQPTSEGTPCETNLH